jgi:hypothetical protein
MFGWLKSLFLKDQDRWDLYSPRERLIYSFSDGRTIRKADPMALYKRFAEKSVDLSVAYKVANSLHKDAPKMHDKLMEGLRAVFSLEPYSDKTGGLTDPEVEDLFGHFMAYCERVKKNSKISAIPSMASTDSGPTLASEGSASSSSLPTGSIGEGLDIASPTPSPPESKSPSDL